MNPAKPSEINDAPPSALSQMVGQRGVVAQVAVALEAARADHKKFDSALLVGSPGLGKSACAAVIAKEMGTTLHEVLGQSVTSPADLNALLLSAKDRDVIHIDEAHELEKEYQTALYLAIDQRRLFIQSSRPGRVPQSIPIADFTLLLSTTDEYCLLQPLRDRMRLTLRFEFYNVDDLTEVLAQRSRSLGWMVESDVLGQIARRARGTPRLALRLLQSCRRVCRAQDESSVTAEHLRRACELEQLDQHGLGATEQAYLRVLSEGPTRLNVIASVLGLPARTVSQVTESFLIRSGFVTKDDQGRRLLTPRGHEHVTAAITGRP